MATQEKNDFRDSVDHQFSNMWTLFRADYKARHSLQGFFFRTLRLLPTEITTVHTDHKSFKKLAIATRNWHNTQ